MKDENTGKPIYKGVHVTNSTGVAIGSGANVQGNTFGHVSAALPESYDYMSLITELEKLLHTLRLKAGNREELEDVAVVLEAHEAAEKKDGKTVLQKLKLITNWGLHIAKEIGANIIANLITQ